MSQSSDKQLFTQAGGIAQSERREQRTSLAGVERPGIKPKKMPRPCEDGTSCRPPHDSFRPVRPSIPFLHCFESLNCVPARTFGRAPAHGRAPNLAIGFCRFVLPMPMILGISDERRTRPRYLASLRGPN